MGVETEWQNNFLDEFFGIFVRYDLASIVLSIKFRPPITGYDPGNGQLSLVELGDSKDSIPPKCFH